MANYLKPQSPLQHKDGNYFYPLTTIDQIITDNDTRLNAELISVDFSDAVDNNGEMIITNANMLNGKTVKEIFNEIINYSIVGSVTEPSNPAENMIWVETSVEITKHIFSKNKPKNPIEGMVWIYLGNNSNVSFHTLNINEKEFDEVYPLSAQQYVNGSLVNVTAKIYQSGKWVEWTKYLYNAGDECTSITGGWQTINGRTDGYTITGTYTDNGDSYTLTANAAKTCVTRITKNKIDLTEAKTIFIVVTETTGQFFDLLIASSTNTTSDRVAYTRCEEESNIFQIDVSDLTGMYYIAVQRLNGDSGSNSGSVTVSQIYME